MALQYTMRQSLAALLMLQLLIRMLLLAPGLPGCAIRRVGCPLGDRLDSMLGC